MVLYECAGDNRQQFDDLKPDEAPTFSEARRIRLTGHERYVVAGRRRLDDPVERTFLLLGFCLTTRQGLDGRRIGGFPRA